MAERLTSTSDVKTGLYNVLALEATRRAIQDLIPKLTPRQLMEVDAIIDGMLNPESQNKITDTNTEGENGVNQAT